MFTRIGRFTVRRRRLVLALSVLFVLAAGAGGAGAFGVLEDEGFDDPGSESSRASRFLHEEIGTDEPEMVLLVESRGGTDVDDPSVAAAGTALTAALAGEPEVATAISYWSLGGAAELRSTDGTSALVVVDVDGDDETVADLSDRYAGTHGVFTVGVGGEDAVDAAIEEQLGSDLARAESLAIPATLVLLVLVFGGVVAASLPLAMALVSVTGTLLALFAVAQVTDVSIYSINLTTALGLGLAIDYSLFIVSRFREELAAGRSSDDAVVARGRNRRPHRWLLGPHRGRLAVGVARVPAVLPAVVCLRRHRRRAQRRCRRAPRPARPPGGARSPDQCLVVPRQAAAPGGTGNARVLASPGRAVMRRPVPVATGVIVLLLVLGSPFLRVNPGLPSYESLPESNEARQVAEALATQFDGNQSEQFAVVLPGTDAAGADAEVVAAFADRVSAVGGVADVTAGSADAARG